MIVPGKKARARTQRRSACSSCGLDTVIRYDPSGQSRSPGTLERKSTGYAQAMRWIDEHYQETFYLDDLADAMHLSKFYLSKLFHEETGSTLKEYVTAKRMRQACRSLETTAKSVEWIGSEVGISNPSYFVQVFKHEVGTTPLKYRTGFIHSVHGKGKRTNHSSRGVQQPMNIFAHRFAILTASLKIQWVQRARWE